MHIPGDKKFYNVAKELYSNKRIQEVKATKIGDLVFINASSHPDPISEQFDNDVINSLQLTEKKLSDTFLEASIELNFNWKLIFENLRDGLHPLYLHKSTLTKEVDFGFTKNYVHREKKKIERISEISSFSRDGKIKQTDAPHKRNFQLIDDKNMYLNWLLYPYTHISSPDGGALIGIENYVPISSSKTRLDLTFCITKSLGRSSPLPILYKWFEKAALVFKEDFDAVTSIQRRAKESEMQQNIGEYENRNLSIFEWMKDEIYE